MDSEKQSDRRATSKSRGIGWINSPPQILQQPEEEDNLDLLKTAVRLYKGLS